MIDRLAGSMIFSVVVLMVVSLLVSFGALWWTGSAVMSAAIGTMCALAAAFAVDSLHSTVRRAVERLRDENDRSSSGIADHGRPSTAEDPKGSHK